MGLRRGRSTGPGRSRAGRHRALAAARWLMPATLAPVLALAGLMGPAGADPGQDPAGGLPWHLTRIHADEAWNAGRGRGVIVAVVDSGVEVGHEDLAGRVVGQAGCIGAGGDADRCGGTGHDDDGHGTHVAGIVAASADNGPGAVGVAPEASLLAVRVLERRCDQGACVVGGSGSDVAAGIRWAVREGAHVINLSLGNTVSRTLGPDFDLAIEEAWSAGTVVVLAAGTGLAAAPLAPDSPAIIVTATTREDGRPAYTGGSPEPTGHPARFGMAAPGGEPGDSPETCTTQPLGVRSTYVRDGQATYGCLAGTSMAAPHVAGAAALLRGIGLDADETRSVLLASADDLGEPGPDGVFGAGRLHVARAVEQGLAVVASKSTEPARVPDEVSPLATVPAVTLATTRPPRPPATNPPAPGVAGEKPADGGRLVAGAGAAVLAAGTGASAWRVRRRQR